MHRLQATALASLAISLALTACTATVAPTSAPPSTAASLSPTSGPTPTVSDRSPTPRPSVPEATATTPSATPTSEPAPVGRLVYGRFDSRGVTPFTSNTDGTDERQL